MQVFFGGSKLTFSFGVYLYFNSQIYLIRMTHALTSVWFSIKSGKCMQLKLFCIIYEKYDLYGTYLYFCKNISYRKYAYI